MIWQVMRTRSRPVLGVRIVTDTGSFEITSKAVTHVTTASMLISPGTDGMPDRLVMLPKARIGFVEVKASGAKPRPLQVKRHKQLRDLGFHVSVLDDPAQIPGILKEVKGNG